MDNLNPNTLWKPLQEKLSKANRKWTPCDYLSYRFANLLCEKCGKVIGKFDIVDTNLDTYKYCSECVKPYIINTPKEIDCGTILEDYGTMVKLEYTGGYYEKIIVDKVCYFIKKGRYIIVKNKRYYLNEAVK